MQLSKSRVGSFYRRNDMKIVTCKRKGKPVDLKRFIRDTSKVKCNPSADPDLHKPF